MDGDSIWRRLRGAVGNAVVWGGAWAASALVVFGVLRVMGILPQGNIGDGIFVATRFGVVGAMASVAFSSVVRLLYRGRRLSEISWVRFALGGAAVAGAVVLGMMVVPRLMSGEPMLPLTALLSTGLVASAFGGIAAGGSLKLAQRAESPFPGTGQFALDDADDLDRLTTGEPAADAVTQRTPSTQRSK